MLYKVLKSIKRRLFKFFKRLYFKLVPGTVACNICGWVDNRFDSHVWHERTSCPNCFSQIRHRLFWTALSEIPKLHKNNILKNKSILHFAPDHQLVEKIKNETSSYTTADFFAEGYSYDKIDINLDISNMDAITDGKFDCLIAFDVLEHVKDHLKGISSESDSNDTSIELEEVLVNARRLQSIRDDLLGKKEGLLDTDLARLEKMVPESVDNVKLILELQGIANQYSLEIQTASADREDSGEEGNGDSGFVDVDSRDYGIIALDFNLTGTYDEFFDFLRDLERNLRITDIRNVTFSSSDTGEYSFQLTLETYWLKDNI